MGIVNRAELVRRAEVDPWGHQEQLSCGDPAAILELAAAFYRAGGHLQEAASADTRSVAYQRAGYTVDGVAPVEATVEAQATALHLADAGRALPLIAATLSSVADELRTATAGVTLQVQTLDAMLGDADARWAQFSSTLGSHVPLGEREQARAAAITAAVEQVRAVGQSTTSTVFAYEAVLGQATKRMSDLGFVAPSDLATAGESFAVVPPHWMPPAQAAGWWRSLSPAEQEYVLDHDPVALAALGGLPAWVYDRANRRRLRERIRDLRRRLAGLPVSPDRWGERVLLDGQLQQAVTLDGELSDSARGGPPAYLLSFAPGEHGDATMSAVAYGDPDAADNTAVMVPGTGNDPSDSLSLGHSARSLHDSMSGTKSVIVWLDGREPPGLVDAASASYAGSAAPRLIQDLTGIRAAHDAAVGGSGHLTLIGHSYGSLVAGEAVRQGAPVDDVAFVGSPGVGVDHAGDLGLDPSHVWSGQAGDDPILGVEHRFTPDPLTGNNPADKGFGAQHFDVSGSHGHSQYYEPKSESVSNLGRIASGDYADVHRVGAPDYRGVIELPGDALDVQLTPIATAVDSLNDLAHGHPGAAWNDVENGARGEWEAVDNTIDDAQRAPGQIVESFGNYLSMSGDVLEAGVPSIASTVGGMFG